jgi:multiple antibiotic resistance protein
MLQELLAACGISLAAMFPIINPIGHAPMFYMMTEDHDPKFRRVEALKTSIYTFLILLISLLLGKYILLFFSISLNDLRIAGGLLVAKTAWHMLGNHSRVTQAERDAADEKEDVSLTPMATPVLSGPGAMSLAMGMISYGQSPIQYLGYIIGFLLIGLLTWFCLRYAEMLVRVVNENALGALNRILGFFILAIGVDLVVTGVKNIFFPHV